MSRKQKTSDPTATTQFVDRRAANQPTVTPKVAAAIVAAVTDQRPDPAKKPAGRRAPAYKPGPPALLVAERHEARMKAAAALRVARELLREKAQPVVVVSPVATTPTATAATTAVEDDPIVIPTGDEAGIPSKKEEKVTASMMLSGDAAGGVIESITTLVPEGIRVSYSGLKKAAVKAKDALFALREWAQHN